MKDIIKQDVVQRLLPLLNNEQIKGKRKINRWI